MLALELVTQVEGLGLAIVAGGAAGGVLAAGAADVLFRLVFRAEFQPLTVVDLPRQLAEEDVLLIGRGHRAQVGGEEVVVFRAVQEGLGDAILVLALIGAEEVQAILDDRPAQAGAVLQTAHRGLFGAATTRDLVLRHPVGVLVEDEGVAVELVGARPRHGGDDGRTGLFILGLEVLADDAELLHRALREWRSTAVVLAGDTAVVDQRLAVLAVDEDVDGLGGLAAGGNRPLGVVFGHAQARRQGGEVQEVAADLR